MQAPDLYPGRRAGCVAVIWRCQVHGRSRLRYLRALPMEQWFYCPPWPVVPVAEVEVLATSVTVLISP
jgi:hypothetical protein